jgi:hypothetical protein
MYSYFSDLHVDLLAQALLEPGEQRIGQTVGTYLPWWALGFINETYLVIATDRRLILVEHRMAWFHQAQRLHSVQSLPWPGIQETRVKGLFGKKLVVSGQGQNGPVSKKLRIPNTLFGLLAPMRNNVAGARAVATGFQNTRGLAAAPSPYAAQLPQQSYAAPALPAAQPYAPPAQPQSFAQPQAYAQPQVYAQPPQDYALQQVQAQAYAQQAAPQAQPIPEAPATQPNPVPAFNAPGYASVPPASAAPKPSQRGVAPLPPRVGPRPPMT